MDGDRLNITLSESGLSQSGPSQSGSSQSAPSQSAPSQSAPAYLLVVHGSRNQSYQAAVEQLAALVLSNARLREGGISTLVAIAFLELHPLPLHRQIAEFASEAASLGCSRIQVLPVFLHSGVHVMEDIPAEVSAAREILDPQITIELRPYLGTNTLALSQLLASEVARLGEDPSDQSWILLSHGSRRPSGNLCVVEIAARIARQFGIEVLTAYWSMSPTLEERIAELAGRQDLALFGSQDVSPQEKVLTKTQTTNLVIVPYFLFAGGITEAIALSVSKLRQKYANIPIQVREPLGPSEDLAAIVLQLGEF